MRMAQKTGAWTLAQLDRLPDDGNKYELVDGELFVTPTPSPAHEAVAGELIWILLPYVKAKELGRLFFARAVVQQQGSQVEPDMMVRPATPALPHTWAEMPTPSLVVEILSRTTRQRDHEHKRAFYLSIGVAAFFFAALGEA